MPSEDDDAVVVDAPRIYPSNRNQRRLCLRRILDSSLHKMKKAIILYLINNYGAVNRPTQCYKSGSRPRPAVDGQHTNVRRDHT